ncbi:ornithine cyclodeaminase family protein [Ahrensia marina]|uniref:ornithine cyclodeaminase family protein n=1 Tax=Ahrensia marina TaxID=1514904 RepID=UPI0035D0E4B7
MTRIVPLVTILPLIAEIDVVGEVECGFVAFSQGKVTVPPVGELLFPRNKGEMHIKYGAIEGDDVFVIKIATGFFDNPSLGLPPFGGCMLVLSQKTGMVEAVLLEEGELTNHRTAAAGAVAAKALAPSSVERIGIIGTGVQARLQADYLTRVLPCRRLDLWGRSRANADQAAGDIARLGYDVEVVDDITTLTNRCQVIVTTTPAHAPLLRADMIAPGTHITAMGSDTEEKQELTPDLVARADVCVVDSLDQSRERGEVYHARKAGVITDSAIVELGAVLSGNATGRTSDDQITIADLTGVAAQDIAIAKAVLAKVVS